VAFQPRVARNGRGAPSETAYPLTAEAGKTGKGDSAQCVATPATVRRLTPTECERLQGFPDGWTDGQADSPRYRQLGNAVTVNVAEWIGRRIMEAAL
jgi:DNA (cytosine-5)-methyltransferase 1